MATPFEKEIEAQKRRSAKGVAYDLAMGMETPVIGTTNPAYAKNEMARAAAGQMPQGDANAAQAAANVARSAGGGAMIDSNALGNARMSGAMANTGANAFVQPQDAQMNRARAFASRGAAGTNQQIQQARNEMGTNNTSLTQMAARLDPAIKMDAERAREWRIMAPQQRRAEVDRMAIEQDARMADRAAQMTSEDIQGYGRTLADASGTFVDSYGRSNPMYAPDTQIRIRNAQREIEKEWAGALSGYDKTKWQSPQDMYDAISALPSVQKAGEFGRSIAFNIVRKYSTPQMKAQMEAEDRNQKAFEQTFTSKAAEEIVQRMAQEGQVSPEYAQGYKFTNDGSREFATQIWLNRDKDPRAGQIVNEIMANAPVMWEERDGRVVPSEAHNAMRQEAANRNGA